MKRTTSIALVCLALSFLKSNGQAVIFHEAPLFDNSTSTGRGPNGTAAAAYMQACGLVRAVELAGIAANSTISSFGFTLNAGAATNAPTGNFTVYLQNTADATYNKGTNFATAITGMTQVYANLMTIPISAGTTSVMLTLSTPFIYTGGGIYVAYDWYCPGPYSTAAAVYRCNSGGLSPGLASNAGTTPVVALGTTAFRPCFLFGVANTYTNEIVVVGMEAPGRVAGVLGTGHSVLSRIRNSSSITKNNIVVSLNVSGANSFVNTQTVATLAAGATTIVNFAQFTPLNAGLNTLSVSVPNDENNANNLSVYTQSVTCNEWALNPAGVSYTLGSVGYNTGSGIIAVNFPNPVTSTLTGLRGSISTNTPSIGNQSWGVLLNAIGAIVATTNTITITGPDLGTFKTYTFTTPQNLATGTTYYLGFAQPANATGYFPMGTYTANYVPFANFVTTSTLGGVLAPLTSNLGFFGIEAIFESTLALAANTPTVNCGTQAVLSATTAASYTWSGGPSNTDYSVTPLANSVYTVNAVNPQGCAASITVPVTVNQLTVTASGNTSSICAGGAVNISASGAATYTWSTGPALNSSTFTDSPGSTTTYSVIGSNPAGCLGTDNITIQVFSNPTVQVSSQTVVCGTQATLVANTADSYTWVSGPVNSNYLVTPTINTTYSVIAETAAGCSSDHTVMVAVDPITVTASSSTSSICLGSTVGISGAGATSYSWSAGPNPNSQNFADSPVSSTVYSVTGSNAAGCSGSASVSVTVNSFTNLTVSDNSISACSGASVTVLAAGASSYTWNTGSSTFSTAALTQTSVTTGNYTVTGADPNGCTATLVVTVTALSLPNLSLSANATTLCAGESTTITASGAATYSWFNGSSNAGIVITPSVASAQVYSVTGTGTNSCVSVGSISIKIDECTGIAGIDAQELKMKIFPNPSNGVVAINFDTEPVNMDLRVCNSLGVEVLYVQGAGIANMIDLEQKSGGVYFIIAVQNNAVVGKARIVKN